jgi:hypothetical protein
VLALAEQQAAELIEAARVEADMITASAASPPPAPESDQNDAR